MPDQALTRRSTRRLIPFFSVAILVASAVTYAGSSIARIYPVSSRVAQRSASNSVDWRDVAGRHAVSATGHGSTWVQFDDGLEIESSYSARNQGRPLALASSDFDGDGMPDLAVAVGTEDSSRVRIFRGNLGAVFPNAPEAREAVEAGVIPAGAPFHSSVNEIHTPVTPDFLVAGDFDRDSNPDLAVARAGDEAIYLLPGDGRGGFGAPRAISVPGTVTTLAIGDVNRPDGLKELLAGVSMAKASGIVVITSASLSSGKHSVVQVNGTVREIAVGDVTGARFADIVAATSAGIFIAPGLDSAREVPMPVATLAAAGRGMKSIAIGDFSGGGRSDVAILRNNGAIDVLAGPDPADRPATASDAGALLKEFAVAPKGVERIVAVNVSSRPGTDLAGLDRAGRSLSILEGGDIAKAEPAEPVAYDVTGSPVAILPMRLNADAIDDLVVLADGSPVPVVMTSARLRAVFTVTNTNDSGSGSLRDAIQQANGSSGSDSISFNIPGPGPHTILLSSPLPVISETLDLDASTEPDFAGTPIVVINGTGAGTAHGIDTFGTTSTKIRGFVVRNFVSGAGVLINSSTGAVVEGCYLGTTETGTVAAANMNGISISGSGTATVGGTTAAARNVLSGNTAQGIAIFTSNGTLVNGNYIGVTSGGNAALGNGFNGVEINESTMTTIGDGTAGAANVISGNTAGGSLSNGLYVHGGMTDSTLVSGNIIGLGSNGSTIVGNGANGVLNDAPNSLVGGMAANNRNVISGNVESGVRVESSSSGAIVGGNYIGLDVSGTLPRSNGNDGVWLAGGGFGTVGGFMPGQGNVISGNGFAGVKVSGGFNQLVAGNLIGRDEGDSIPVPNSSDGVRIAGGASVGVILNTISGNSGNGVGVTGGLEIEIAENAMSLNNQLGIDLNIDGVTANDAGDADTGPGDLQNFPIVTSAVTDGGVTTVMGTFNSTPLTDYRLLFYISSSCDGSGNGEGLIYAGNILVSTDSMGDAPYSFNLDVAAAGGQLITATASELGFPGRGGKVLGAQGGPMIAVNSSEFSPCFVATSLDADLGVSISDTPDPVAAGADITYTVTASNLGPLGATNATVLLTGPMNTTFQSASAPPGWTVMDPGTGNPGSVTLTASSFAAGPPAVFTIVYRVDNFTPGATVITGDVSISSDINDPVPSNDADSTTTTVQDAADLSVVKDSTQTLVVPGADVTYTVDVSLLGPDPATNVTLTDVVPANMTFQSITPAAGWTVTTPSVGGTGTITATRSSVAVKTTHNFTITLRLNLNAPGAATITNTATVTSMTFDPNTADNSESHDFVVDAPPAQADLSLTRTANPDPALRGQDLTYTITVTNNGPDTATSLLLTETLPAEATFVSFNVPAGWTAGGGPKTGNLTRGVPLTASASGMASGSASVFTVVVNVPFSAPEGTVVIGNSAISSSTFDPNTSNNSVETQTPVAARPQTNLLLDKTASPSTVTPGSTITYTLTSTNIGSANAPGLSIADATPAGTKFVSAQASTGGAIVAPPQNGTGAITCTWAGDTAPGESRTLTVVVSVDASVEDGTNIVNSATTTSLAFDTDVSNNSDTATVAVSTSTSVLSADVDVSVSAIPTEIDTGEQIAYSILVRNNGPDTSESLRLRTATPDGTRLVSVTTTQGTIVAPPAGGTGLVEFAIGDLASGSAVTLTLVVNVVAEGGEEVTVGFVVESTTNDPVAGNNSASGSTEVLAGNDVLLTWDPPLPSDGDERNPPLHLQSQNVSRDSLWPRASKFMGLRNTLVGYNIYRSNSPNSSPVPANFFTSVPAGTTTVVASTAPGGSFFTVTATYPNGESGGTNEASGGIPEPEITSFQIKGNKVVINGAGFTDQVTVFIDGIPFTKAAKVKKENTRVQQKGRLLTGQSVAAYLNQQNGVILVSVLNEDTGIGTFLYRR